MKKIFIILFLLISSRAFSQSWISGGTPQGQFGIGYTNLRISFSGKGNVTVPTFTQLDSVFNIFHAGYIPFVNTLPVLVTNTYAPSGAGTTGYKWQSTTNATANNQVLIGSEFTNLSTAGGHTGVQIYSAKYDQTLLAAKDIQVNGRIIANYIRMQKDTPGGSHNYISFKDTSNATFLKMFPDGNMVLGGGADTADISGTHSFKVAGSIYNPGIASGTAVNLVGVDGSGKYVTTTASGSGFFTLAAPNQTVTQMPTFQNGATFGNGTSPNALTVAGGGNIVFNPATGSILSYWELSNDFSDITAQSLYISRTGQNEIAFDMGKIYHGAGGSGSSSGQVLWT